MNRYEWYRNRDFSVPHAALATAWWITGWRWLLRWHVVIMKGQHREPT